ncbi:Predicted methyltransferase regulatory domain-containing protein [Limimonas halophila]|uniref:Predicted methyltransferase regulatory domain-containing protein n=1 Tax=Limimonas halophila TaxID=1082479 RepID=A0A1G7Q389_9PROT|nr:methyltransferase domain-containing protein [Limimonas halophila]SDF92951.1 Predicted methyltransferase regulatory domain-containing protein [Limimonas halophila]
MEQQAAASAPTTSGYYARDVAFRSGVIHLQSPVNIAYTAASQGFVPPDPCQPFTYMDLGCGDGTTLNAWASIYPDSEFVGIDFNPGHIERARRVAREAGLENVRFLEASFADVDPAELPAFDFIGMNGIYSWLEEDLLAAARSLVGATLKPGGLFYVEFTLLPGTISQWPLWHLIQGLVPPEVGADSRERANTALNLLEKLVQGGMGYLRNHPQARQAALNYIQNRKTSTNTVDHFAHNALASGFRPRFFTEMANEMAGIGLSYVGRAATRLNELEVSVPVQQANLLREVEDPDLRELLIDYIRNDGNRRAVWVKDGQRDEAGASDFLFKVFHVTANRPTERMPRYLTRVDNTRFELSGGGYDKLFAALGVSSRRIGDLDVAAQVTPDLLVPAVRRVLATGEFTLSLQPTHLDPEAEAPHAIAMPNPVNRRLLGEAAEEHRACGLVSPVSGGRVTGLGAFQVLFLDAWLRHGRDARLDTVAAVAPQMSGTARINGEDIQACDLTHEHLTVLLERFDRAQVPTLLAYGVIEPAHATDHENTADADGAQ